MNTVNNNVQPDDEVKFSTVLEILSRRRVLAGSVILFCVLVAVVISIVQHKSYDATAVMVFNQRTAPYISTNTDYDKPVMTVDTLIGLVESPAMTDRTEDWISTTSDLTQKDKDDLFSKDLKFKVENPKDTNLLSITATAHTPKQAAALANGVCYSFIDWTNELAHQDLQKTVASLGAQAAAELTQLRKAEVRQQLLQRGKLIVNMTDQQQSLVDRMGALQQQIDTLKQQVASAQAKESTLSNQLNIADNAIQSSSTVRDDPGISLLQQQLTQAEVDLADANQKYTSKYPGMLDPLKAKVADLKSRLAAAVSSSISGHTPSLASQSVIEDQLSQARVDLASGQAQLAAALAAKQSLDSEISSSPALRLANDRFQQDVDIHRTIYASIQSSLTSTKLMLAKINGDVQMTQTADVPDASKPSRPIPWLYTAIGLIAGIALATFAVLFAEFRDQKIYTLEKLRYSLPAPPVGGLEMVKLGRKALPLAQGGLLPQPATAYSLALANLELTWSRFDFEPGDERHSILVTSAVAGEGKTTTAVHLAKMFAMSGRSVLLVDADFGNPSLKRVFNYDVDAGLIDVLHNRASVTDAIKQTDHEHLSVMMQSGSNSSAQESVLVTPTSIRRTVSQLLDRADIVIFDAPPCTVSADALLIAPHVDTILQVVGLGVVQEQALNQTANGLKSARARTFVTFINRLSKGQIYYSPYGTIAETPRKLDSDSASRMIPADLTRALPEPESTY